MRRLRDATSSRSTDCTTDTNSVANRTISNRGVDRVVCGRRVEKTVLGAYRDYVYEKGGNVFAEDISAGWQVGHVYLNGRMLAEYKNSTTHFVTVATVQGWERDYPAWEKSA